MRSRTLRMPRRPWQAILVALVVSVVALVQRWHQGLDHDAASQPPEKGAHRIERVVDGDTLVLTDVDERVRLLGVDTPETVKPNTPVEPWGPEATAFTKKFLAGGQARLEFDGPRHDKYGRLLAYVWVEDRMLNEELLRAGLARAELQYHFSAEMKARLRRAETEAKAAHRGIWSK
jgi:micrococcal nuclease